VAEQPTWVAKLWPDPEHGPFRLRYWIRRIDGRPVVVGVEMWGVDPVGKSWTDGLPDWAQKAHAELPEVPVGAQDVRLPLGKFLDDWVKEQNRYAGAARQLWGELPGYEERVQRFAESIGEKRRGRPRLSEAFLQRVTDTYNEAVRAGSRKPNVAVQRTLAAETLPTARGWVSEARKRGFPVLPPPINPRRTRKEKE
jgi:hypothetical protein